VQPPVHFQKRIRLQKSEYQGQRFYFVTICCHERNKIFANAERCHWLLDIFRAESSARDFAIHAYCVMPDHFHFLAEGTIQTSDLVGFIKSFRIKTSRLYALKTSQVLWQKKYFDHILRRAAAPESVAWYIWTNPVRSGLSSALGVYPFAGSFTGLMDRLVPQTKVWSPPWKPAKTSASEGGRYKT
jgi:putative transposase